MHHALMRAHRATRWLVLALLLGGATAAHAQRGIDAEQFHPALDGFGLFNVERAQTVHRWQLGFQIYANYADSPLRLGVTDPMTGKRSTQVMLTRQTGLDVGAWLGLADWLEAALDAP